MNGDIYISPSGQKNPEEDDDDEYEEKKRRREDKLLKASRLITILITGSKCNKKKEIATIADIR